VPSFVIGGAFMQTTLEMGTRSMDDKFSDAETERRMQSLLQGAFSGPPTPLKDIPKRDGESRSIAKDQSGRAKRDG
jgi:hypothetical protein